jgi:hypothetical protein
MARGLGGDPVVGFTRDAFAFLLSLVWLLT